MNIFDMKLSELCEFREKLMEEGLDVDQVSQLILEREQQYIQHLLEDGPGGAAAAASIGVGGGGVAYANASIGGMGPVVSSQPSIYAGATTEPNFSAGGGKTGSGDVSVPYNPGGRKKVFQKLAAPLSDRKGSNKRRKNKILKGLKNIFSQKQDYTAKQGQSRQPIMSFDNFSKEKINKVTKVDQ